MATIRPRNAKTPFEIHADMEQDESLEEEGVMDESRVEVEAEEDQQEEDSDDYSDESDDVVDATVQDDMDRFKETFRGINERFKLIKRIGEGNSPLVTPRYPY